MILTDLIFHYEQLGDGDKSKAGYQPYMDPATIWTEGIGHAILDSNGKFIKGAKNKALAYKYSKVKTKEDAYKLLEEDLKPRIKLVKSKLKISVNDNQLAALTSFVYNCGYSNTLFKLVNEKSKDLYEWWTTHYTTSGGKVYNGLIARRKTEATLYTKDKLVFYN